MTSSNVVEMQKPAALPDLPQVAPSDSALILAGDSLDRMMKFATVMAQGRATIPKHLQGNAGDCLGGTMQAMSWRMTPFAVAQKTHFVNGAIGFEAQLIYAAIVGSGVIEGRPTFEWYGDWTKVIGKYKEVESKKVPGETYRKLATTLEDERGVGCRCSATIKGESTPRVLDLLLTQAGVRNSPLWADDPRQQLAYLSIKRWARLYAPDVIMGVYSPDELEEIRLAEERNMGAAEVVGEPATKAASVRSKLAGDRREDPPARAAAPTLEEVLTAIRAATTPEQMSEAAGQCAALLDPAEKETGRKAYRERLNALKAQAQTQASGETSAGPTYADIADQIGKAQSTAELNTARDLIRSVRDDTQRGELEALAETRANELAQPAD